MTFKRAHKPIQIHIGLWHRNTHTYIYISGKKSKVLKWNLNTMKYKIWHLSMHTDLFKYADVYGTGTSHPPPMPFVHNPCRNGRQTVHIVCSFAIKFKHMHVLFLRVKWTAKQYTLLFFIKQLVKWILTSHQQHKVTHFRTISLYHKQVQNVHFKLFAYNS